MLTASANCQIIHVGELKGDKFKKCLVKVVTKELRDEISNDLIRPSGTFDNVECVPGDRYDDLKQQANQIHPEDGWIPCHFILRSYVWKDKKTNQDKLGMQLQLKRWWR